MNMTTRSELIEKLVTGISMPRVQISVILAVTALAGFITSVILLRSGVTSMMLRYPIAVIVAYCVFLICLRIWIWRNSSGSSIGTDLNPIDAIDGIAITELGSIGSGSNSAAETTFGGAGKFSGGGTGGSWSEADLPKPIPLAIGSNPQTSGTSPLAASSSSSSSSSTGGSSGFDLDLDDGIALVIVLIVIALVLSALIYIVWIAPVLFAELLIDAALVGGLYGSLKGVERRHWLITALRKTAIPALVVIILLAIAGFVMEAANPDAVTFGQFLREME